MKMMITFIVTLLLGFTFSANARILTEMEQLPAGETADGMSSTAECPVLRVVTVDTESEEPDKVGNWWISCDPNTYPDETLLDPFALPAERIEVAFQCYQINADTVRCYWVTHGALRYFDYYSPA